MIKIKDLEARTSRPSDLDAQLLQTTGCGVSEIDTILAAGVDRAALALRPFLGTDAPQIGDLARIIAADPDAVPAIRKLYAGVAPADASTETQ